MAWFYLLIAGMFEIIWAVGIKYSNGFSKLLPSIITIAAMALSIIFLALAMKTIPLGTSYAVWTGIGAIGVCICGKILFGDPVFFLRILFLSLILIGVLGLKFVN